MADFIIGLGSNLGPRLATLRSACDALAALPGSAIVARSAVYESAPLGPPQPDYLNAAVRLRTSLSAEALLDAALAIERAHGRQRRERWGPRTLDLDLLHGPQPVDSQRLRIPHPELPRRWFALRPLLEVAPELHSQYAQALMDLPLAPSPFEVKL